MSVRETGFEARSGDNSPKIRLGRWSAFAAGQFSAAQTPSAGPPCSAGPPAGVV